MNRDITEILKYDAESSSLDFKKEQYPLGKNPKRNELLKDITSFANHHSNSDKYIFIGVKEKNGVAGEFFNIDDPIDEAGYQQFVLESIEPKINFEYKIIEYNGLNIAYFRIFGNTDRPYLFKKDVKNPQTSKLEYRAGDGFIRTGTSTKKIDRNDLDIIYRAKFTLKDRKDDLTIKPYFNFPEDEELSLYEDLRYMDVEIINNSNKSIDIDVEMKVYKGENYKLITEPELKEKLREKKEGSGFGFDLPTVPSVNFHIDFSEEDDFVIISRDILSGKTAISLPQNDSEKDVFDQYLYVLEKEPGVVKAEIIIRSDDFTEGVLIRELIFKA